MRSGRSGRSGGGLAALLRSVAALTDPPAVEPSRDRLLDALAALVRALAADRPLLVVADDLHLADASSWVALHHLAHECVGSPVLVVGTVRRTEAAPSSRSCCAWNRTVPPAAAPCCHSTSTGYAPWRSRRWARPRT